ncbi:phosphatidylinositol-4 kinase plasma membrane scaffold Erf3 partner Ypp1 [Schizosaccharomyces osmophilus]|uniref:Phosphatidylinositol-4 kinase plasma membrane scaffold Erf3 partner Ypp1 n=1 Tax=Schizosaccharomyces osmophilus TaxID=2545709 RepID=A0AAF0AVZ8_9SCHI|nr:phosphatidylinositol-4 kinase plasma membrane scaffold Erf3 partner Ypp1 [Schizosaccharomyces osmophilus]WBW74131.1 phosphatidylinositol-4 kinase plasma membrane scaffold Erf3 partner Ypp1 [Schizosaccharomyces osmophilus]
MLSAKAKTYESKFEEHRCNGEWQAIPEAARKLNKHYPSKSYICDLARIEAALRLALQDEQEKRMANIDLSSVENCSIFIPTLSTERTDPLLQQLNHLGTQRASEEEKLQEIPIRLLLYISRHNFQDAVDLDWSPDGLNLSPGIIGISILQATILSSLAHFFISNYEVSYQYIRSAIGMIQRVSDKDTVPLEWAKWCELCYAVYAQTSSISSASQLDRASILGLCSDYFASHTISDPLTRIVYFRQILKFSHTLFHENKIDSPIFEKSQIQKLHLQDLTFSLDYAKYLLEYTSFPRAGDQNLLIAEYVESTMSIWVSTGQHYTQAVNLINILYRLTEKSFHCQQIFRSLVILLTHIEEHEEAHQAFQLYKFLCTKAQERNSRQKATNKSSLSDLKPIFIDPVGQIIHIASLMISVYSQYLNSPQKVIETLDFIMKLSADNEFLENSPTFTLVLHAKGVANSFLYYSTNDPNTREEKHEESIFCFKKILEIEPDNETALYHLAMQLAEKREIVPAVETIRYLLKIAPNYSISAWHLLILLLSCSEQYDSALKIADSVLESWNIKKNSIDGSYTLANPSEITFMNRCALIELMITKVALYEAFAGVKVAIDLQEELFTFFVTLFDLNEYGSATQKPRNAISSSDRLAAEETESEKGSLLTFSKSISSKKHDSDAERFGTNDYRDDYRDVLHGRRSNTISAFNQKLWLTAANLFVKSKQYDQARGALLEAKKLNADSPGLHLVYGYSLLAQNREKEAVEQIELALYLDPHDPIIATTLAKVLLTSKDDTRNSRDRADSLLSETTLQYGWDLPEAWFYCAELYQHLGDEKQAAFCYDYCIQLSDTNPIRRWNNVQPRFMNVSSL